MEYIFQTTPLDVEPLIPLVSRGLEQRTEQVSREKYPGMWRATDRLRTAPKISPDTSRRRRKRSGILGALCLALGVFAFVPGVMEPRNLPLFLAGGLGIAAGLVSLLGGRRRKKNPFTAAARTLLEGQNRVLAGQPVLFSEEGMTLAGRHFSPDAQSMNSAAPAIPFIEPKTLLPACRTFRQAGIFSLRRNIRKSAKNRKFKIRPLFVYNLFISIH